jgi:hypothetical protein
MVPRFWVPTLETPPEKGEDFSKAISPFLVSVFSTKAEKNKFNVGLGNMGLSNRIVARLRMVDMTPQDLVSNNLPYSQEVKFLLADFAGKYL